MKIFSLLFFVFVSFLACKNKTKPSPEIASIEKEPLPDTVANFFPVTSFIKGELFEIKRIGITPIKKITLGGHTDSSYVKIADLNNVFAEFLLPVIDSANLKSTFKENKFLDQSVNAFTFTYEPINQTDAFPFRRWDVYVDPDKGNVTRLYMVKKTGDDTELQMTWVSGKSAKIITFKTAGNNKKIEKEEKISWSYN